MATNNFERLFEEENERFEENQRNLNSLNIENNIWQSMGLIRLIGQVMSLFLPRVDLITPYRGGDVEARSKSTAPSQGGTDAPHDIQPRSPGASFDDPRQDS